jgi:WD40 repeat protein
MVRFCCSFSLSLFLLIAMSEQEKSTSLGSVGTYQLLLIFFSTAANDLKKLYSPESPQTRKLIAHSGPVYSLSFDPIPGPSSPPRYLLSSSADSTIRLWSLETYANLAVYRGHREPVWAVEWGPRGVYFASASRDRTARLWTTEKVNAVRIFAGHLSDVNVRILLLSPFSPFPFLSLQPLPSVPSARQEEHSPSLLRP